MPFTLNQIPINQGKKRILDFGCTKSYLALQLASFGHDVVAIDLRNYEFKHPNLTFYNINILDFDDEQKFDYITAISVLEHVGLGHYEEEKDTKALNITVLKLVKLLKNQGKLIVTVPFGKKYENTFLRSFTHEAIISLFSRKNLELIIEAYYYREKLKFWKKCDLEKAKQISNSSKDRGPFGVNCIGCFVWQKVE